ncbi:MAG TPA: hypothetical protein VFB42_04705 [Gaiellaceae bacterium]|nr:hypothetical protein [Gaiellaceae bacterium]
MALARVVSFSGVSRDRIGEMEREMEGQEPPEGLDVSEMIVLHRPEADEALVLLFFENEDELPAGRRAAERDAGERHAGEARVRREVRGRLPYDAVTGGGCRSGS